MEIKTNREQLQKYKAELMAKVFEINTLINEMEAVGYRAKLGISYMDDDGNHPIITGIGVYMGK